MFDPSGLNERYRLLVKWDGVWVNYCTETVGETKEAGVIGCEQGEMGKEMLSEARIKDNDAALVETGIARLPTTFSSESVSTRPESTLSTSTVFNRADSSTFSVTTAPTSLSPSSELTPRTKSETKALEKASKAESKAQGKEVKALEKEAKALSKEASKASKAMVIKPHHFVVLPTGLGERLGGLEKWEKVIIAGVGDEVAAHTGLFIKNQNLDYDKLVVRVGKKVLSWCEGL